MEATLLTPSARGRDDHRRKAGTAQPPRRQAAVRGTPW